MCQYADFADHVRVFRQKTGRSDDPPTHSAVGIEYRFLHQPAKAELVFVKNSLLP
jgi:hypothetical protein